MEQRPLRLGDLVDDYCPRERRVTNHAIVAIVNDAIRQTRCTTCEAEHTFKGAKVPRHRLAKPVAGAPPPAEVEVDAVAGVVVSESEAGTESVEIAAASAEIDAPSAEPTAEENGEVDRERDAWPANRQLIRATLPRQEGEVPPPRPIPEFTIYQRHNGRGGGFRPRWFGDGMEQGRTAIARTTVGATGRTATIPADRERRGRRRHGKKRPR